MRALAVLLAAGCPGPTETSIANHAADHFGLSAIDSAWRLTGSARRTDGALALSYCCVAWATAVHELAPLTPGHWTIAIDHDSSECRDAAIAFVVPHVEGGISAALAIARLRAGRDGGRAQLAFDVDDATPLELHIVAEGGLHCCGTTRIRALDLARR